MIDTLVGATSTSTSDPTANLLSGLIGAVIGAIVGGGLTLLGSVIVNRMERRTQARQQLYLELIPIVVGSLREFTASGFAGEELTQNAVFDVVRMSVVAGPAERRFGQRIWMSWSSVHAALEAQQVNRASPKVEMVKKSIGDLSAHVARKLNGPQYARLQPLRIAVRGIRGRRAGRRGANRG
jgi:hypothetical protein